MGERVKLVLLSGVEFMYLVLLWMAFVSKTDKREFEVGVVVALIGTVADAIVKAEGLGHFRPRIRWVLLIFLEPWYVLKGIVSAVTVLPHLWQKPSAGRFHAVQFDAGEKDVESATRRALATMLLTIPPNSVVVGIDGHNGQMLKHELKPESPSVMSRELGVQE